MKFNNLALTGWSHEKGDQKIPVGELNLSEFVRKRNPVKFNYLYSDVDSWKIRLQNQVRNVVNQSNVEGKDVQAIFGVHNGVHKHISLAAPIAAEALDDTKGFLFEMTNGCSSAILAAQMAGLHMYENSINNILMGSVQMTAQYTENGSDGNCLFADGIGAMMFSRAKKGNMVRYTKVHSDSYYHDMFGLDENGIYSMSNYQKGNDLSKFMVKSFAKQLMEGCRAMNVFPKDIDYIAMSCSTYSATKMVLESANFPVEQTGLECLTKVGHMGTNDLIYQIEHGIEQDQIKKGSKIIVAGTSLGFSIASMAIDWGYE